MLLLAGFQLVYVDQLTLVKTSIAMINRNPSVWEWAMENLIG
jgi:hypothetical protein